MQRLLGTTITVAFKARENAAFFSEQAEYSAIRFVVQWNFTGECVEANGRVAAGKHDGVIVWSTSLAVGATQVAMSRGIDDDSSTEYAPCQAIR